MYEYYIGNRFYRYDRTNDTFDCLTTSGMECLGDTTPNMRKIRWLARWVSSKEWYDRWNHTLEYMEKGTHG